MSKNIDITYEIICSRCVFTNQVPGINFDEKGVCNYCRMMDQMEYEYPNGAAGEKILSEIVKDIKKAGKNKKYDVAVGVSGGTDSSYMLYKAKEFGLRPLAVHFDNTWNTNIATENIRVMTKALDVDLYTIVVNNKEFDDIIRSFILAGVPEQDVATDIALATTLYKACAEHGIKYQFEGHSFRTEGIAPAGWGYMDARYIKSVLSKYGTHKIKTLPNLWFKDFIKYILFMKIKKIRPLYYLDYHKENTKKFLAEEFGWKDYGGHHHENRWSYFLHSYFKPARFGIDQRANGYAALARSNQIEREEGIHLMNNPIVYDKDIIDYVKKRLGFSEDEFEAILSQPHRTYKEFKTYKKLFEFLRPFFWVMYKTNRVTKSFYIKYTKKHTV